ncbi:hypothetical protein HJFPF1_07382 [Paramyrothecium foliicola]|nr:hypothetical protein HJFPF1_07382 [Paramyrothecium foliicola]
MMTADVKQGETTAYTAFLIIITFRVASLAFASMANPRLSGADLPEVVPPEAPQVAYPNGLHPATNGPAEGLEVTQQDLYKKDDVVAENVASITEKQSTSQKGLFGWSKRRLWVVIVIAVLVVIAIVVGATVGSLTNSNNSSGEPGNSEQQPNPTSTTPDGSDGNSATSTAFGTPTAFPETLAVSDSTCHNRICPQALSLVQDSPESSSVFLFGLGQNEEYIYREADGEEWIGEWNSLGDSVIGQPWAVNTGPGRIDVFGLQEGDGQRRGQTRALREGSWDPKWTSFGGDLFAAPSACAPGNGRMLLFSINNSQRLALREYSNGKWGTSNWIIAQSAYLASSPRIACADGIGDLVAYGGNAAPHHLMVKRWDGSRYTSWIPLGGDFRGDPVAARVGSDKTVFFGLGPAGNMLFADWTTVDEEMGNITYTNIGGDFMSVPSVLVTGDDRVDVVAVGTDGKLKHNALLGDEWLDDWEDLGGFFNSAPSMIQISGGKKISVFGIGPNADIIHGQWELGDAHAWGEGSWFTNGGNFSSNWFRAGPA